MENSGELRKEKNVKLLIIILLIITLISIVVVNYDKVFKQKNKEITSELLIKEYSNSPKTFEFNNEKYILEVKDSNDNVSMDVVLNQKQIYKLSPITPLGSIGRVGDLIVVCTGSLYSSELLFFDLNGNRVNTNVSNIFGMNDIIYHMNAGSNNVEYTDNKLIVNFGAFTGEQGGKFYTTDGQCYNFNVNDNLMEDSCRNADGFSDDVLFEGRFSIEYLGDYKFSGWNFENELETFKDIRDQYKSILN